MMLQRNVDMLLKLVMVEYELDGLETLGGGKRSPEQSL